MASAIEAELLEVTGFKGSKKLSRQEYLIGLLKAVDRVERGAVDNLTDEAFDWVDDSIKLLNTKRPLEDFPDNEDEDKDEGAEPDPTNVEPGEKTDEVSEVVDTDPVVHAAEAEAESANEAEEAEQELSKELAKPKPKEKAAKADKKLSKRAAAREAFQKAKRTKQTVKESYEKFGEKRSGLKEAPTEGKYAHGYKKIDGRKKTNATRYDNLTGELDEFGCIIGTQNHEVLQKFKAGCTMKSLKEEYGVTYYNLLKRTAELGHTVSKQGNIITVKEKGKK